MNDINIPVHIEVEIKDDCLISFNSIEDFILLNLKSNVHVFQEGLLYFKDFKIPNDSEDGFNITQYINKIRVCEIGRQKSINTVSFWQANLILHLYKLSTRPPEKDYLDCEEEDISVTEQWELPNQYLDEVWDSIIVDNQIKSNLLGYIDSSLLFANSNLSSSIISWNRMVLLHGPPGTGKTSICKGLANKLAIRQRIHFSSSILVEINSHSLFSKWFSESGKLVMKLFEHITSIAENPNCLIVVLIDEVESITATRSSSNNEPSDAIRVVNAVLTGLDSLKRKNNVTVLCTSNIVELIDPAFKDRLDMSIYLGYPNESARYQVILSCINELMKCSIIYPTVTLKKSIENDFNNTINDNSYESIEFIDTSNSTNKLGNDSNSCQNLLYLIAQQSDGMSGRQLRKLPLQAHSRYINLPQVCCYKYLLAMKSVIEEKDYLKII